MSGSAMLPLAFAGWFAIGLALSFALGRRGHDGFTWFVLGTLLGPLAIVLAIDSWRHDENLQTETIATSAGTESAAAVDVLVGFDGSRESRAALASVIELFGGRLGRLTLLTVIPFDGGLVNERQARGALEREAERLAWLAPGLEIARGKPATALVAAAAHGGYDILAVGTTGAGHAHLFGSAASQLAHHSKVPVLLTGTGEGAT